MELKNGRISPYLIKENESAYKAYYIVNSYLFHKIAIVVDGKDKAVGILTLGDFVKKISDRNNYYGNTYDYFENKSVGDICNRCFKHIMADCDVYAEACKTFADFTNINDLPVFSDGCVIDILSRWQVFFRQSLASGKLPCYSHYARDIMRAAEFAKQKGYSEISVIEFGVAGGTGLIATEMFAKETTRLTGVEIQIYGFDYGKGLPVFQKGDINHYFLEGDYPMDVEVLQSCLKRAKLVFGDIRETVPEFFKEMNPAPIGAMFIDVDLYSSTVSILDMLLEKDDYFLPRVFMYFDDITQFDEFEGEWLAIKQFNEKSDTVKIAPENYVRIHGKDWGTHKECRRYAHPKFVADHTEPQILGLWV